MLTKVATRSWAHRECLRISCVRPVISKQIGLGGISKLPSNSRNYSSPANTSSNHWQRHRLSSVPVKALLALGTGLAAWSLYRYGIQSSFSRWPPELREDLRNGLYSKQRGQLTTSQRHLASACLKLFDLPPSELEPDLYLKTIRLLITLADAFLQDKQPLKAYWMCALAVHVAGFKEDNHEDIPQVLVREAKECLLSLSGIGDATAVDDTSPSTSASISTVLLPLPGIHTRETLLHITAVALKLGSLCQQLGRPISEEVLWTKVASMHLKDIILDVFGELEVDIQKLLQDRGSFLGKIALRKQDVDILGAGDWRKRGRPLNDGLDLPLPEWTSIESLTDPLEMQAAVDARRGHTSAAHEAYHNALSILETVEEASDGDTKIRNMCRQARIHNDCAEVFLNIITHPHLLRDDVPSNVKDSIKDVRSHAMVCAAAATELSGRCLAETGWFRRPRKELWGTCINVLPVANYNLGRVAELDGRTKLAKLCYEIALASARLHGMKELEEKARKAFERMKNLELERMAKLFEPGEAATRPDSTDL